MLSVFMNINLYFMRIVKISKFNHADIFLKLIDISISHICWHTIPRSWVGRNHEELWCTTWSECHVWPQREYGRGPVVATAGEQKDEENRHRFEGQGWRNKPRHELWSCCLWTRMIIRHTCCVGTDTGLDV